MAREERIWFGILIMVFVLFNAITLSPIVPWQKWLVWSKPTPDKTISIEMEKYEMRLPRDGISVGVNQYVEFVATSKDVTYGLGVFRPNGTLVFQMQVLPGRENKMLWRFDAPGTYDIRSTEYSGPRHSEMFIKDAVRVTP